MSFIRLFYSLFTLVICTVISQVISQVTHPLLTPIPPSYMVAPESNIANTHTSKKLMSPNFENTIAKPDDTALSIQRGRPPSRASTESSCSSSPSLMNDSPPSDCDYAERVAAQNNINIKTDNTPPIHWPPEIRLRYATFTNATCPPRGRA